MLFRSRKGDQLANGSKDIPCEHNIRHNGTMYAAANMVRARACGKLVLGDKANPQTTFHLNEGHVTDMCEIGGDPVPARCPLRSQGA